MQSPLLTECPVNLECRVVEQIRLPSHSLFIAEVVTVHAEAALLNQRGEIDFSQTGGGLGYAAAVVRERPVDNFRPEILLSRVRAGRDQQAKGLPETQEAE